MVTDGHNVSIANTYYTDGLTDDMDGIVWLFRWGNIETSEGVYNFTNLEASLSYAAAHGKKVIPRLFIKSYTDTNDPPTVAIAPAYVLADPATYGGEAGSGGLLKSYTFVSGGSVEWRGWVANITNAAVLARVEALIAAVAARIKAHEAGHAFAFDEFLMGVYTGSFPEGVTQGSIVNAYKSLASAAITAMGDPQKVLVGLNFVDGDSSPYTELKSLAQWVIDQGAQIMLCDVFLTDLPSYPQFSASPGGLATIDFGNSESYPGDDEGLAEGALALGVRSRSLGAGITAWHYRGGSTSNYWTAARAAISALA